MSTYATMSGMQTRLSKEYRLIVRITKMSGTALRSGTKSALNVWPWRPGARFSLCPQAANGCSVAHVDEARARDGTHRRRRVEQHHQEDRRAQRPAEEVCHARHDLGRPVPAVARGQQPDIKRDVLESVEDACAKEDGIDDLHRAAASARDPAIDARPACRVRCSPAIPGSRRGSPPGSGRGGHR